MSGEVWESVNSLKILNLTFIDYFIYFLMWQSFK